MTNINKIILMKDDNNFYLSLLLSQLWIMVMFICGSLHEIIFVIFSLFQAFIWSALAFSQLRKKYISQYDKYNR
jgi:hypothetical protein